MLRTRYTAARAVLLCFLAFSTPALGVVTTTSLQQVLCPIPIPENISLSIENYYFKSWAVYASPTTVTTHANWLEFWVGNPIDNSSTKCWDDNDFSSNQWLNCRRGGRGVDDPAFESIFRFNRLNGILDVKLAWECFDTSKNSTWESTFLA